MTEAQTEWGKSYTEARLLRKRAIRLHERARKIEGVADNAYINSMPEDFVPCGQMDPLTQGNILDDVRAWLTKSNDRDDVKIIGLVETGGGGIAGVAATQINALGQDKVVYYVYGHEDDCGIERIERGLSDDENLDPDDYLKVGVFYRKEAELLVRAIRHHWPELLDQAS